MIMKRIKYFLEIFFIACIPLSLVQCSKDKDFVLPVIHVISPTPGLELSLPDSIRVVADVSDNEKLELVRIVLVNSDRIAVGDPKDFTPAGTALHVETYVWVTDVSLATDEYFLLVYASDGVNSKSEYIPVIIHEVPRELLGFVTIQSSGSLQNKMIYYTTGFEESISFTIQKKYSESTVNHTAGLLYFISPEPSELLAFPYFEDEPAWRLQATPPYPEYTAAFSDHELILASANGHCSVHDRDGQIIVITPTEPDRPVAALAANDDYIVCEKTSIDGQYHYLYIYYRITGGLNRSLQLSGDVAVLVPVGQRFLVVMKSGQGSEVLSLEPAEVTLTPETIISSEEILDYAVINDHTALLLSGERIYRYDLHYNTLSPFAEVQATGIFFEPLGQILVTFNSDKAEFFSYPQGIKFGEETFAGELLNLHPIYNK